MDIGNIHRIANREKLVEDLNKVQQKVSKENEGLIKLKVEQDTAFWALKEKYAQAKSDHERLQQNMLELQMQYETLSGQYQDQLRYRPETLNKLNAVRKISEVLEEMTNQCKQTSSRTKADQVALYEAYTKADEVVRNLKQTYVQKMEMFSQINKDLEYKLKLMSENQSHMKEMYGQSLQRAENEILEVKNALRGKAELAATVDELTRQLVLSKTDIDKRDATISNLEREMKVIVANINSQLAEAKNLLMEKDNNLKNASEEIDSLKKALSNQEDFTKSVCDQNSELQEKFALTEEEHQKAVAENLSYETKLGEITSTCEKLNSIIATLNAENEALIKEVNDKREMLTLYDEEIESFKKQLLEADTEIDKITSNLNKATEENEQNTTKIAKLETEIATLSQNLTDSEIALKNYRESAEDKEKKQSAIIKERTNELEAKTSTIIQASYDLQTEKNKSAKLEMTLEKMKTDWEIVTENAREKEKILKARVSQCEATIRAKDEELTREMSQYLQGRSELEKEKKALQDKLSDLEERINNIVKEASNTRRENVGFEPEPEDHAMLPTQCSPDNIPLASQVSQAPQCHSHYDSLFDYLRELSVDSSNDNTKPKPKAKERRFFKSVRASEKK